MRNVHSPDTAAGALCDNGVVSNGFEKSTMITAVMISIAPTI